ncbi:zinc-dependent alcohol dehydrogenase [Micromonospora sp. LZ34]
MRALVLRDFWDFTVEERPDPVPGPGEVLLRITATGICGSDLHGFTGENGRRVPGQVMGHETVGRVVAVGPDSGTATLVRGQLVTVNPVLACGTCRHCAAGTEQACPQRRVIGVNAEISAAFAELMTVPVRNVVPLPESMPEEYGALVEPLAVGYHAARRGGCVADDRVLVIGGGPIGQACVLAARRIGATKTVVTEPSAPRRELIASLGIATLNPSSDDLADQVATMLDGPATLVLDAVGATGTLADAFACSDLGARIVLVGMASPQVELAAYRVSTDERTIVGSFTYSASEFQETARWVGTAPPELSRLIEARTNLDDAPAAFTSLALGDNTFSKILVFPGSTAAHAQGARE